MLTVDDNRFAWLLCEGLGWNAYGEDESLYPILKGFFDAIPEGRLYNYTVISKAIGDGPAWMLIYAFCKQQWINYGTSPRYGWLENEGEWLWRYTRGKTAEQLETVHQTADLATAEGIDNKH